VAGLASRPAEIVTRSAPPAIEESREERAKSPNGSSWAAVRGCDRRSPTGTEVAYLGGDGDGQLSLKGELEDLPIVDIVQVVALTGRSGQLRIETAGHEASIDFRDGRIVGAHTWKSAPLGSLTFPATSEAREDLIRRRTREALRHIVGLNEGRFEFRAAEETAPSRPRFEELSDGLDAQGELLDLVRQRDESAPRAASAPAPPVRVDLGDQRMIAEFKRRLEAVLVADPGSRYAVAIAYKGMGLLDDAIRELERAARDPRYALPGSSMLGLCYLEKGDAREAIRWLEKGLALPGRTAHEYHGLRLLLGLAYSADGRLQEALELYQQLARRDAGLDGPAPDQTAPREARQVIAFPRTGRGR
jgi:hypothetical protein